ncbi:hypothetical protein GW17_00047084 [Ensete ventricosum]|nr:hypothetical protein GW17_00047084 [Ensete ventricosum]
MGNRPCGRSCCPRVTPCERASSIALRGHYPCWRPLVPAATLARGSRGREATPCGFAAGNHTLWRSQGRLPLAAWSWALPTPAGTASAGASHAHKRCPYMRQTCLRATALVGGYPLRASYPCRGLWPWPAIPARGLAMANHPFPRCVSIKMQQERIEQFYSI